MSGRIRMVWTMTAASRASVLFSPANAAAMWNATVPDTYRTSVRRCQSRVSSSAARLVVTSTAQHTGRPTASISPIAVRIAVSSSGTRALYTIWPLALTATR